MNDSWDEMRRAKEEAFFKKANETALNRVRTRDDKMPRLSPLTGKPMEQLTIMGVAIDRCTESGGIWLDAGELEQILKASKVEEAGGNKETWFDSFFNILKK